MSSALCHLPSWFPSFARKLLTSHVLPNFPVYKIVL